MMDYGFARPGDEMEIVDLANMVFSMADAPTDFVRLHPAVYSRPGFAGMHAVAREEGRMVAMAALKPMQVRLSAEERLACGFIGTVCTHPRHERRGHMRRLMQLLEERGRGQGMAPTPLARSSKRPRASPDVRTTTGHSISIAPRRATRSSWSPTRSSASSTAMLRSASS